MAGHRPAIVSNHDTSLVRREIENFCIREPFEAAVQGRGEIDASFMFPDCGNKLNPNVGVRLEAN